MQLFGTTGQKFPPCPGTKRQRDELKILPRDGTGRDSQNSGRDGPGQPKSGTGHGTKRDRAEKDVLKRENDVLKQFTPALVPGHRDTGTRFFLSRDKGTTGRPVETLA